MEYMTNCSGKTDACFSSVFSVSKLSGAKWKLSLSYVGNTKKNSRINRN